MANWKSKEQRREYYRKWRNNNREKRRQYQREYYLGHWEEIKEKYRLYYSTHKKEHNASKRVSSAIKRGKIERRPCEICGEKKAQAHHFDYAKVFSVQFLCASCHKRWHLTEGVLQKELSTATT